jgi:hypothetical protein
MIHLKRHNADPLAELRKTADKLGCMFAMHNL